MTTELVDRPDVTPARVIDSYRAALNSVGTVREWPLDGFDHTGLPVTAVVWTPAGGRAGEAHGVGYGSTWPTAQVGALGEVAERVVMSAALQDLPVVVGTYRDLVADVGLRGIADPLTLTLPAGSPYSADRQIAWVAAVRWRTGEQVLVPVEFVASDPTSLPPGSPAPLITPITNGLGAGDTMERAIGHGLLELVQRDGDTVSFRALDQGVVIDLGTLTNPAALRAVSALRRAGIEPIVKLASTEFACVVYAMGRDGIGEQGPPLAATAIGEAAHPDAETAICSALLEYASSRARRSFAFGPLGEIGRLLPDYLEQELTFEVGTQEARALEEMTNWTKMTDAQMSLIAESLLSRESRRVRVVDLPTATRAEVGTPDALLRTMSTRLADFDVLTVTGRIGGIWAAKVIVPGLEVETLSYLRIGERVLRRLLDRGSPLVGLGLPDQPGRLPVRLDARAAARIGSPAWLDRDEVEIAVGQLYPLYREPRRHAVARLGAVGPRTSG